MVGHFHDKIFHIDHGISHDDLVVLLGDTQHGGYGIELLLVLFQFALEKAGFGPGKKDVPRSGAQGLGREGPDRGGFGGAASPPEAIEIDDPPPNDGMQDAQLFAFLGASSVGSGEIPSVLLDDVVGDGPSGEIERLGFFLGFEGVEGGEDDVETGASGRGGAFPSGGGGSSVVHDGEGGGFAEIGLPLGYVFLVFEDQERSAEGVSGEFEGGARFAGFEKANGGGADLIREEGEDDARSTWVGWRWRLERGVFLVFVAIFAVLLLKPTQDGVQAFGNSRGERAEGIGIGQGDVLVSSRSNLERLHSKTRSLF